MVAGSKPLVSVANTPITAVGVAFNPSRLDDDGRATIMPRDDEPRSITLPIKDTRFEV